jgi:uncharacterized protein (TIGR03000 family)
MRKQRVGVVLATVACVAALVLGLAAAAQPGGEKQTADITIIVPANAEIFFNGQRTTQKGTQRVYVTPPLAVGKKSSYNVRARWQEGGKVVEQTRKVEVTGGARVEVNFLAAAPTQAVQAGQPGRIANYSPAPKPSPGVGAGAAGPHDLAGTVKAAGSPIAGATVTLYVAGESIPTKLVQIRTGEDGTFKLMARAVGETDGKVLYLVARGGTAKAAAGKGPDDAIGLMTLLGSSLPETVTINELTTVASAFTAARFINGESIAGNPLGLRIAAGNVPNLVDPATGGWSKVLVDPFNSTQTTTLANLNTLGSLISAFVTVADDDWRGRFLKAATTAGRPAPRSTLEAMAGIARTPWAHPKELYALFDQAYPQPKDGGRRKAPFVPYLAYTPPDFTLSLWFGGGGSYSNGNMIFDAEGNMWSGVNWMAGSQSGVHKCIGGGLIKFSPNGTALSPPITGFTGMGVDGIGWGTGVTLDKVWVSSFNGAIGVHDFEGRPIGKESDIPFAGKTGQLMGIGVAAKGDIWIADGSKDQLLYFPGGRLQDGRIVHVKGLKSPFGIAIDDQNRVCVSNSQSVTVLRFPAADPSKVETFRVGIGARGVALDSKGNLWVASLMSPDFPLPKIPEGVSIMKQFALILEALGKNIKEGKKTGIVSMIRPDGSQLNPEGFTGGGAINAPWGVVIDGNDDVFVASGLGRGIAMLAGAEAKGHPAGTKPGDLIHYFQGGSIQIPTVGSIDPAGNLWVANNWNSVEAATAPDPIPATSTWGGGSGFTVVYGVAAPVRAPLMGQARGFD